MLGRSCVRPVPISFVFLQEINTFGSVRPGGARRPQWDLYNNNIGTRAGGGGLTLCKLMLHPLNYHCTGAPGPKGPAQKKKSPSTQRGPQKFHETVNFILREGASRTLRFPRCTTVLATPLLCYATTATALNHCCAPLSHPSLVVPLHSCRPPPRARTLASVRGHGALGLYRRRHAPWH